MSVMELDNLLTRSGLMYLEVSSEVCHDSFCQLGNSVSLSWAVCHEAFCLHVVSSSSCIPVVYLEPMLFLTSIGVSLFNYQDDALSNKHKSHIYILFSQNPFFACLDVP